MVGKEEKKVFMFSDERKGDLQENKLKFGGKGAGLAQMTKMSLPVPEGFTIPCKSCAPLASLTRITTVGALYLVGDTANQVATTSAAGTGFTALVSNTDIPNTQRRGCCL